MAHSAVVVERQVDEAVGVAQVHLHPVQLCGQVHCQTLRDYLHLRVHGLNSAAESVVVEHLVEEIGEGAEEHLADSDRRSFFVPLLESFGVFSHNISVLIEWQLRQLLVQLDKGVMRVGQHTDSESFKVTNVLEQELA